MRLGIVSVVAYLARIPVGCQVVSNKNLFLNDPFSLARKTSLGDERKTAIRDADPGDVDTERAINVDDHQRLGNPKHVPRYSAEEPAGP